MATSLGLDIGSNSVGSAWVDTDGKSIHLAVSVFPAGVDEQENKRGAPKNQARRQTRSQRRTIERRAGLFTASTGNHGLSIAFAGKVTGTAMRVAVPEEANSAKVAAMRGLGAEVVAHGRDFDEAREWIEGEAARAGARFIGPTEPDLIPCVATYAIEILMDLPDAEVIIVPVGAGSGASGVGLVIGNAAPDIEVIAVQAERAPAVHDSWRAGHPVAAAMQLRDRLAGRKVVLVLSGGNISMEQLRRILSG